MNLCIIATSKKIKEKQKILNPIYAVKFMEKDYYQVFNSILKTIILFGTNNRKDEQFLEESREFSL